MEYDWGEKVRGISTEEWRVEISFRMSIQTPSGVISSVLGMDGSTLSAARGDRLSERDMEIFSCSSKKWKKFNWCISPIIKKRKVQEYVSVFDKREEERDSLPELHPLFAILPLSS